MSGAQQEKGGYIVVFMGIGGEHSNHPGIRTRTEFKDGDAFRQWRSKSENNSEDVILAEGISDEEAQQLASESPFMTRFAAAVANSTFKGKIDMWTLKHELFNLVYLAKYNQSPEAPFIQTLFDSLPELPE